MFWISSSRARPKNATTSAINDSLFIAGDPSPVYRSLPTIAEFSELQMKCNGETNEVRRDIQPRRKSSIRDEPFTLSETFYSLNQDCSQQACRSNLFHGSINKTDRSCETRAKLQGNIEFVKENFHGRPLRIIMIRVLDDVPNIIISMFGAGLLFSTCY